VQWADRLGFNSCQRQRSSCYVGFYLWYILHVGLLRFWNLSIIQYSKHTEFLKLNQFPFKEVVNSSVVMQLRGWIPTILLQNSKRSSFQNSVYQYGTR